MVSRRMLVTGAAGFIASHLVDALLARGDDVLAVDRKSVTADPVAASNLAAALSGPRLTVRRADLSTDDLDDLVGGCDTVFHLAAVAGVRQSWGERFGDYVSANIVATHRLLEACERGGVRRLVLASSSSVYGAAATASRETDATCPVSPYGVSKLAAEQLCFAHSRRADAALTVLALRYFTVYGPRQRPDMAIARILRAALRGTVVELYGDGRQRREFTYVSDVVAATIAAADTDTDAAVANVGGGASVTLLDVVRTAEEVTGMPVRVAHGGPQAGDVPATHADLSWCRQLLAYQPAVDLRTGMARQADWLTGLPPPLYHRYVAADPEMSP